MTTPEQWDRLVARGSRAPNGCLLWTERVDGSGYGVVRMNGHTWRVHRLAYIHACGPIPEGFFVCHHCDTPACFEPAHLFAGTPLDNVLDRERKGRGVLPLGRVAGVHRPRVQRYTRDPTKLPTHCVHGHPFEGENLRYYAGKRRCRECQRVWRNESMARRRAQRKHVAA